ncbi:12636_t:CDS:2, partial [Rhizophagus irregularis]
MNLGFNGSMIPEYKNTKYYQHSRARIPSSQSQSSYPPRQTSTNHPRSVSERYSRSTTSSLHDNSSLKNESIKSFSYYHKKIKSWDEREVINDEILQLQKHSSELCPECRKLFNEKKCGKIPFYHEDINPNNIIQGSRPGRPHSTPVVYIQLMESCWDSDPRKRPTANYLISMLDDWIHSKRKHLVIIYNSFQHAENERKNPELTKIDQISINQTNQSISNSQLNSNISPTAATPRKKQKSILIRIL